MITVTDLLNSIYNFHLHSTISLHYGIIVSKNFHHYFYYSTGIEVAYNLGSHKTYTTWVDINVADIIVT